MSLHEYDRRWNFVRIFSHTALLPIPPGQAGNMFVGAFDMFIVNCREHS
jgi:hypothetical protein